MVVTVVTYGQGICPKERGIEEETSLVGDVVGITIKDRGVVRGEDKWSFVRGGVFVIVGGVANITMGRTPLPFWLKMGGGIIQKPRKRWKR